MSDTMKPLIYAASEGPLSRAQAEAAFEELFEGTATPAQIGGLLMAMRARGAMPLTLPNTEAGPMAGTLALPPAVVAVWVPWPS